MSRHWIPVVVLASFLAVPSLQAQDKFLGKNADAWVKQLKSDADAKQRRNAAFALGKMGNRALPVLADMKAALVKEKDVKVREALIFALADISRDVNATRKDKNDKPFVDTELERLFLAAAQDEDRYLRRSAVYALGCLGSKSKDTRHALDNALGDQEAMVRQNAAWALGQFGEEALPSLSRALRDLDSLVKRDAAGALLQIRDADKVHDVLKDLLPLCRDTNSEVRRAALNVLVRIVVSTDKEAIPALRWALQDTDLENQRNAALALSNIGGEETKVALPVLLEAIRTGDAELRSQAVAAIFNIGAAAKDAVPQLMPILRDDKDAKMRRYAALALGGIGKESAPAIPLLIKKIQDPSEERDTRAECAMTLARIGAVPASAKVVPALLEVLADAKQDIKVRERVVWALRVHGGNLRAMTGPHDTFAKILREPVTEENKMLRYDCAYMLGMIWQREAPELTLDILGDFLKDDTIKIFDKTVSGVGGVGTETQSGKANVDERGKGDGRTMATDALQAMGPARYARRPEIMQQLRVLAADKKLFEPLRKHAAELLKAAQ